MTDQKISIPVGTADDADMALASFYYLAMAIMQQTRPDAHEITAGPPALGFDAYPYEWEWIPAEDHRGNLKVAWMLLDIMLRAEQPSTMEDIFDAVASERDRQDRKWGEQNHPDGTGGESGKALAKFLRDWCDFTHAEGAGDWVGILAEEMAEVAGEEDPDALREELIQVMAVCENWIEAIGRRPV